MPKYKIEFTSGAIRHITCNDLVVKDGCFTFFNRKYDEGVWVSNIQLAFIPLDRITLISLVPQESEE